MPFFLSQHFQHHSRCFHHLWALTSVVSVTDSFFPYKVSGSLVPSASSGLFKIENDFFIRMPVRMGARFADVLSFYVWRSSVMFFTISSNSSTAASGCSIVSLYVQRMPIPNCHHFQLYLRWHLATTMWSSLLSCDQMSSSWQQMTERRFHRHKLPSNILTLNKRYSLSHHSNRSIESLYRGFNNH